MHESCDTVGAVLVELKGHSRMSGTLIFFFLSTGLQADDCCAGNGWMEEKLHKAAASKKTFGVRPV